MVLYAHSRDISSLFYSLPRELITFLFIFLSKCLSKESKFVLSHSITKSKSGNGTKGKKFKCINSFRFDPQTKNLVICAMHNVQIFDKDLVFVCKFGTKGTSKSEFEDPKGVDISKRTQKIYVSSPYYEELYIFDKTGKYLSNSGKQSVNQATTLTLSENDDIFVADGDGVKVFNPNGEYLYTFGQKPSFQFSEGISVSRRSDKVFVSDAANHRILVFSQKGQFLFSFGQKGTANGLFDTPMESRVDDDENVFIADNLNNRVQVFDGKGNFLLNFGCDDPDNWNEETDLCSTRALDIDEEGNVYVCDGDAEVYEDESKSIKVWKYK